MSTTLGPDDFESLDGGITPILGRGVLQMFEFDPKLCEIKIEEDGSLVITQKGHLASLRMARGFWRKAENIPVLCQNSSCRKITIVPIAESDKNLNCPSCGSICKRFSKKSSDQVIKYFESRNRP